jgi:hypothetical protein
LEAEAVAGLEFVTVTPPEVVEVGSRIMSSSPGLRESVSRNEAGK